MQPLQKLEQKLKKQGLMMGLVKLNNKEKMLMENELKKRLIINK
jgi:hypothetical protein